MSDFQNPEPPKHTWAHSAALAGVAAPIIAILLNIAAVSSGSGMRATPSNTAGIAPMVGTVLVLVGFVCAMLAVCNMERFGRKGLFGRGIVGLVLNGGILSLFMFGVISGISQRVNARQAAHRQITAAVDDVGKNARKYFDSEKGITNVDYAAVEKFRRELDSASKDLDPESARIAKVSIAYVTQMENASRKLQSTLNELQNARVLDMEGVTDKQEIQRRKEIAQRYLAQSENVRAVVTNSYNFYRIELRKLGSSPENIEKHVRTLETSGSRQRQLLLEVRDADATMIKSMLGALDLLEKTWGKWQVESGKILFENKRHLENFNSCIRDINYAGKAQVEAQRQLVNLR